MPTPLSRTSLVDGVLQSLREALAAGQWVVGSKLPTEAELSEQLGVGRNTVREAVRVLVHSGNLAVRQGHGTVVLSAVDPEQTMRRVSLAGWADHVELLTLLESEVARFAAARRTPDDIRKLDAALAKRTGRAGQKGDEAFARRDHAFHMALAKASHNTALEELYAYFARVVRDELVHEVAAVDLEEPGQEAHAAVVEAIRQGDARGAVKAANAISAPLLARARPTAKAKTTRKATTA
jgi:DNA-binding FadR family transcriptional regulator